MAFSALVLEDSPTQLRIVSTMLTQAGWGVVQASDVQTALRLIKSTPVDLILMDIFLEKDCSLRHLESFRSFAAWTPIAVMSAGATNEKGSITGAQALDVARKAKVDFLLNKPFSRADLEFMLREVKDSSALRERASRILVVEDSATIRSVVRVALKEDGHSVAEAETMEDAIARIDILRVDLVVTDIFLPGMGGMAGIGLIKKTWPDVAILAMTSGLDRKWEASSVLEAATALGAAGVLSKPFERQALKDEVQRILRLPSRKDSMRVLLDI